MTGSLLTLVREKQAEATRQAVKSRRRQGLPESKLARARLADEIGQLVAAYAAGRDREQEMVRELIREAVNQSPENIDRVNKFLQKYLGIFLEVFRLLDQMAADLDKVGHPVAGINALARLAAEYERWREDLPEQLALASRPVNSVLRKRIAKVLATRPRATDWRSLCD
jgi:hypothetical protein